MNFRGQKTFCDINWKNKIDTSLCELKLHNSLITNQVEDGAPSAESAGDHLGGSRGNEPEKEGLLDFNVDNKVCPLSPPQIQFAIFFWLKVRTLTDGSINY